MEKRNVTRTNDLLTSVANMETDDYDRYRMIDVTARDVSAQGTYLYAETENPPELGQKVRMLLHSAPELKHSPMMFQATGVVIRLEDGQLNRDPSFAVQFEEVPESSKG